MRHQRKEKNKKQTGNAHFLLGGKKKKIVGHILRGLVCLG